MSSLDLESDAARWPASRPFSYSGRHRLRGRRALMPAPVGVVPGELARPIVWRELFGRERPVEVEIGVGRGNFLTEQARARPQIDFLGIEWSRAYWEYACDRLRRQGCLNARVARAEALAFLGDFVAEASVSAIHLLFPDPWPKKRHHKRRLFQGPFLRQVERVLAPGGRLQVITDHRDYFEQVERLLRLSRLRPTAFIPPLTAAEGELAGSNFERKYRRQGRPLFALAATQSSPESWTTPAGSPEVRPCGN